MESYRGLLGFTVKPDHLLMYGFASLALLACGDDVSAPERDRGLPIQTSELVYRSTYDSMQGHVFEIPLTYYNHSDSVTVLDRCGPRHARYTLDKLVGSTWRSSYPVFCDDVARPPIELFPGDTLRLTYWFATGTDRLPVFGFTDDRLEGVYRLAFIERPENGESVKRLAISNSFRLVSSRR